MITPRRQMVVIACLLAAGLLTLLMAPFVGMESISWDQVFGADKSLADYRIFWQVRVPRVLLAYLAGTGLALAGMTFQSLFRNPLATPFTLGIASGASLGAAIAIRVGFTVLILGVSGVSIAAFAGAMFSVFLVFGLTRLRRGFSSGTLLLAGVAVGFFFSSVILFVQYMSSFSESYRIIRWLMGGLDVVGMDAPLSLLPFLLVGTGVVLFLTGELNLLATGEDLAASRGVDVKFTRQLLFLATSLLVGGVVALCGPIGFVGMMCPHICRLMVGPNHRVLALATALFGGLFLLVCDTFARTIIAPAEIPVGVITALLGGPFFIWLLLRSAPGRLSV
jgi:iron complex transport system permease protein